MRSLIEISVSLNIVIGLLVLGGVAAIIVSFTLMNVLSAMGIVTVAGVGALIGCVLCYIFNWNSPGNNKKKL